MIKIETRRPPWKRPDINKCAILAAIIAAVVMAGVGLGKSALSRGQPGAASDRAATAPR